MGETHLLAGLLNSCNLLQTCLRDAPLVERLRINATGRQVELGGHIGLEGASQHCVQSGILLLFQMALRLGQALPGLFPRHCKTGIAAIPAQPAAALVVPPGTQEEQHRQGLPQEKTRAAIPRPDVWNQRAGLIFDINNVLT